MRKVSLLVKLCGAVVVAYLAASFLFLGSVATAQQCDGDGSSWGWDGNTYNPATGQNGISCAPCNHTSPLTSGQIRHQNCRSGSNSAQSSTVYEGFRVTWVKQSAGDEYELYLRRNNGPWEWLHKAFRDDTNQADFSFTDSFIQPGQQICVRYRIQSYSNNVWTGYSSSACITVPVVSITETSVGGVETPGPPTIQLY